MNKLLYFDEITRSLSNAVARGEASLESVPGLLRMIVTKKMWKKRILSVTGEIVEFNNFEEFVTTLPPEGLGTSIRALKHLCSYEPKLIAIIDRETQNGSLSTKPANDGIAIIVSQEASSRPLRRNPNDRLINISNVAEIANKLQRYLSPEQITELITRLRIE